MARYLEVLAVNRPSPIGVDQNNRTMFSATYQAMGVSIAKFEEELARILYDAGLMTLGTDGFVGPASTIPTTGGGPFITLIDTGGTSPLETHNGDKYERMSIQIIVRALSYQVARTRALAIWRELDGKREITVTAA